jgi:N-acetylglucosamine malate deacetylase 1
MRLMAVIAHPDDAEIWCGGTLILQAEQGSAVRVCALSYAPGSNRGQEAQQGANQMGCEVEFLGLEDGNIRDTDKIVENLRSSMDSFRPDTIITHWYDDMHPDHEAAFLLVRRSLVRGFLGLSKDEVRGFPRIFCCDTYNSLGLHGPFNPDRFVDISHIWEKKIAAISAHGSQPLGFYLDMIDRQCLSHGKVAGTKRAEGFLYVPMFGRPDEGEPLGGSWGRKHPLGN